MDCGVETSFKPLALKGGGHEEKTQNAPAAPPRVFGLREAEKIFHHSHIFTNTNKRRET
jgi:hypothetical protein